jgi:hypothetical protein
VVRFLVISLSCDFFSSISSIEGRKSAATLGCMPRRTGGPSRNVWRMVWLHTQRSEVLVHGRNCWIESWRIPKQCLRDQLSTAVSTIVDINMLYPLNTKRQTSSRCSLTAVIASHHSVDPEASPQTAKLGVWVRNRTSFHLLLPRIGFSNWSPQRTIVCSHYTNLTDYVEGENAVSARCGKTKAAWRV